MTFLHDAPAFTRAISLRGHLTTPIACSVGDCLRDRTHVLPLALRLVYIT